MTWMTDGAKEFGLRGTRSGAALAAIMMVAFTICSVSEAVRADEVTDFYFQEAVERYFESPRTARNFALAGSNDQVTSDSSAVVSNPAALGMMQGGEFSGTYSYNRLSGEEFPTDRSIEQQGEIGMGLVAVPVMPTVDEYGQYGTIGAGWSGYDSDWDDDSFDSRTERTQVTVAYGLALRPDVALGYSLQWTRDKLQARDIFNYPMGDGFRHTLGVMYSPQRRFTFGGSVFLGHGEHHALFGPGTSYEVDSLQVGADGGMRYLIEEDTALFFGVDYRHLSADGAEFSSIQPNLVGSNENGNVFDVRVGLEHEAFENLHLRGGYRFAGLASYNYNRVELNELNGSAYYHAIALGAGYEFPVESQYIRAVILDYGVEYRAVGNNDWQHVVTLRVPFAVCRTSNT